MDNERLEISIRHAAALRDFLLRREAVAAEGGNAKDAELFHTAAQIADSLLQTFRTINEEGDS